MYQELLRNEAHGALPRLARIQRQPRLPVLPAAMLLSFGIRRRVKLTGVMHSERSMCYMVRILLWRNPAMNRAESLCLEAFRDYQAIILDCSYTLCVRRLIPKESFEV